MKRIVFFCIIGFLSFGCHQAARPPLTQAQAEALVCGNYEGRYNKGVEYVEIRSDKTFSQRFIQGGVTNYELEGKWKLDPLSDRYMIFFTPFMDSRDAILKRGPPVRSGSTAGTFFEDEPKVWFFGDIGYFIAKQADTK